MSDPAAPAIQLYTVRDRLAADLDGALGGLASIGFRRVEAFDLLRYRGALGPGLARHGLTAIAAHAPLLSEERDSVFAAAGELGIPLVIQPWTDPARWETPDGIRGVARELNDAAAAAGAGGSGLRVGYHNHHHELASKIDGRHALELLADELDPDVALEVDVYWAHTGGADVAALLRRLGDRVVALHVKDGDGTTDTKRQVAAGTGSVPLREAIAAAPGAARIVELDDTSGDLMAAIRDSYTFVAGLP